MDVRSQQIVVQQRINDRVAEARMARLAREAQGADRGFAQEPTAVSYAVAEEHGIVASFVERVFAAAAAAGHAISPAPPIRVAVRR